MKLLKSISVFATVAFTAVSCLTGKGSDEEEIQPVPVPEPEATFKVTVSASVIYANGTDAAVFNATYGDKVLTEEDLTVYDAEDDSEIELPDLAFSTLEPGEYAFYLKYVDTPEDGSEPAEFTSEVFDITAITEVYLGTTSDTGLTLTLSSTVFQAQVDRAIFVIRFNGEVINDGYTIYDAQTNEIVELPTMTVQSDEGVSYDLPVYTAQESGSRSFWVAYKTYNTAKNPVSVTAVSFPVPMRPGDPYPNNTSFKHRSLLIDFTGLTCGYCPYMSAALEDLLEDEEYASKFVLAAAYTYSGSEAFYINGETLDSFLGVSTYPSVVGDMYTLITNAGYNNNMSNLRSIIDRSQATPAYAGISVRMDMQDDILVARMAIKAAETAEYRVGAWLVEDKLYGKQSNYGMSGDYDFTNHDNVIRKYDSRYASNNYTGHSLGTVAKGQSADYLFVMELDPEWVAENCHVVFFVTTAVGSSYRVTNAVDSKGLSGTIELEYE